MVRVKSFQQSQELVNWWVLELDREEASQLLVYGNWVNEHGILKPGDEVIAEGTKITYSQVKIPCAIRLEKAPKPALVA